jgi:hypothetical protein
MKTEYKGYTLTISKLGHKDYQVEITSVNSPALHVTMFTESAYDCQVEGESMVDAFIGKKEGK